MKPPTSTVAPEDPTVAGITVSRSRCTSFYVASSWGLPVWEDVDDGGVAARAHDHRRHERDAPGGLGLASVSRARVAVGSETTCP